MFWTLNSQAWLYNPTYRLNVHLLYIRNSVCVSRRSFLPLEAFSLSCKDFSQNSFTDLFYLFFLLFSSF